MSDASGSTSWDPDAGSASSPVERGFVADFFVFAWENKWWWIVPTVLILACLGTMFAWAGNGQIAPFFYALF